MRKLALMLFCTTILLIQSCQDFNEIDRIDYNPELAIPLVHSSLTIQEALDASDDISFLSIAADGAMSFDYTQEQSTRRASELLTEIDDFPLAMVDSFSSVPVDVFENLSINQINLKNGTIEFEIQSSHTEDIDIEISFPGITKNGQAFEVNTEVKYEGSSPVITNISASTMEGYEIALPNGELQMRYKAYNNAGDRVLVDIITGMAKNWQYDYIEGIWQQEEFTLQKDTVEIDIFDNWVTGEVSFADPKLHIRVNNSIGFPLNMKIENMVAITEDGETIAFSSTLDEGVDIVHPSTDEAGEEKATIFTLDKNNSNIISILNARPKKIIYDVIGIINPEEGQEMGHITDESKITGILTVEIPVYGTANDFTLESVSEFDLDEVDEIEEAEFKVVTNNNIPVAMQLQVYFTDDQEIIIDSLFTDWQEILAAPETAANGTVMSSNEESNIIMVDQNRMDAIQQATKIKVLAKISTANDATTPIRIYAEQDVEVRAGVKLKINN